MSDSRRNCSEKLRPHHSILPVERTVKTFCTFEAAEQADREFYKSLTGNERLKLLLELINHAPEQRLERVSRITKLPRR